MWYNIIMLVIVDLHKNGAHALIKIQTHTS